MKPDRKTVAWILAQLLVVYSAFFYAFPATAGQDQDPGPSAGIFFQAGDAPHGDVFFQQRASESSIHAWKVEVRIQAPSNARKEFSESPDRKVIRKILVIHAVTFSPCKSVLFFPYHEFS